MRKYMVTAVLVVFSVVTIGTYYVHKFHKRHYLIIS